MEWEAQVEREAQAEWGNRRCRRAPCSEHMMERQERQVVEVC